MDATSSSLADLAISGPVLRRAASALYPAFGAHADTMINSLAALVIVGQALLVVLLVTFVVTQSIGRRNPTLLNVIVVSILAGIPGLLLIYTGNAYVKDVSPMLCLTQAALKNGVDTMFVMAPLALVIELYCSTKTSTQRFIAFRRVALVALPYVTFFGFSLMTTVIGIEFPQTVFHDLNDAYCEVHSAGLQVGLGVFGGVMVTLTIAFNVLTALSLRRTWSTAQRSKESTAVTLSILYRLAGYTVIQMMYLILDTLTLAQNSAAIIILQDLYQASMPLLVFLVYGLSGDIIRVWFCMGPRPSSSSGSSLRATDSSNPGGPRPWTIVGSIASADTGKTLSAPDLEKGRGTPRGSFDKRPGSHVGSDAGSQYSWDPNWERGSRLGTTPPHASGLPLPPPPLPRASMLSTNSPRESRTPLTGKAWGQSF